MLQQTHRAWWCCLCATFWNEAFSNKFVNKWSPHSTGQTSPRLPNTPNKKVSNLSGKYWDGEWVDAWQLVDNMADTMCQWPVLAVLHALFWLFFQQVNLDSTGVCLTVWCMVYRKKHRLIGWDWLACGSVRLVWLSFTVDVSFIILLSALLTAVDIVAKYCLVPAHRQLFPSECWSHSSLYSVILSQLFILWCLNLLCFSILLSRDLEMR